MNRKSARVESTLLRLLLAGNPEHFARVLQRVKQRALTAALADCTIETTWSSTRQAIAGIMHPSSTSGRRRFTEVPRP